MKKSYYFIAVFSVILLGCNLNDHSQSISIKNTDAGYRFEASYAERKTEKVMEYVEKTLKNDALFLTPSDVKDMEVNLGDSVKFYLKSSPGIITLDFKKQDNPEASYNKLVDLCKGIREVLK